MSPRHTLLAALTFAAATVGTITASPGGDSRGVAVPRTVPRVSVGSLPTPDPETRSLRAFRASRTRAIPVPKASPTHRRTVRTHRRTRHPIGVVRDIWYRLATCESGNNPRAVSPNGLYFGLYQFSISTWHSLGAPGNPADASPATQTRYAKKLLARDGAGSWPVCSYKAGLR